MPSTDESRALIVTEYVQTGDNSRRIYEPLMRQRGNGLVDIATIGGKKDSLNFLRPGSMFFSVMGSASLNLYSSSGSRFTGVAKDWHQPFSYRQPSYYFSIDSIKQARKDLRKIADTFIALLAMNDSQVTITSPQN